MEPKHNPYTPPRTQALELTPEFRPGLPKHVEWACTLMWSGIALSTLELLLTTAFHMNSSDAAEEFFGGAIGIGIALLLVYWFTLKLRAGRNWMRWLVTILTILGILASAFVAAVIPRSLFIEIYAASPLQAALSGVQLFLAIAEVVLINTPAARQWFHARSYDYKV